MSPENGTTLFESGLECLAAEMGITVEQLLEKRVNEGKGDTGKNNQVYEKMLAQMKKNKPKDPFPKQL